MDQSLEDLIDAEIQQLHEFKRMAKNPRMVALMRELVTRSPKGAGDASTPAPPTPPAPLSPVTTHRSVSRTGERRTTPNGLAAAVAEAVRTVKPHFSNTGLAQYMISRGFQFVSKSPRVAVMAPMEKLLEAKIVRISRKGFGTQPHLYEYVGERQEEK